MSNIDHGKHIDKLSAKLIPQIKEFISSGRLDPGNQKQLDRVSDSIWKQLDSLDLGNKAQNSDGLKIGLDLIEFINAELNIEIPTLHPL